MHLHSAASLLMLESLRGRILAKFSRYDPTIARYPFLMYFGVGISYDPGFQFAHSKMDYFPDGLRCW